MDTHVDFVSDLTVLVGENASGKSAIIDAIRLATYPASGRPTAWFTTERDLNRDVAPGSPVSIRAQFQHLTEAEKGIYLAQLVDTHDDLTYTATFATEQGIPRRSQLSWAVGDQLFEDPEPALRRRIAHVYLPPLRDAVRDIDGGDQVQLYQVMKIITGNDEAVETAFVDAASDLIANIAELPLADHTRREIQHFFTATTPPNRAHRLEINKRKTELLRLSRLLRLQLAEHEVVIGDIEMAGLGYANLLYIAMIVLQLAKAKENDLTLLLVEEPEAHLHPQLQLVLLDFLRQQAQASQPHGDSEGRGDDRPSAPHAQDQAGGQVQVIVTTHSPVLASTVSIHNVVVAARSEAGPQWSTKTTALRNLNLKPADHRKIDRYLTTTRAALLFARDVVLVEGIAEMLLLPALAGHHFHNSNLSADEQAQRRRQFRSATIVSVEGVDFEPYLRLLLTGSHTRVDRVVVITDRDTDVSGDRRDAHYRNLFASDVAANRLDVMVGGTTLEAEMFRLTSNEDVLREAFLVLHPKSQHHWANVIETSKSGDADKRAEAFAQAIQAKSAQEEVYLDIGKGDFAHLVAEAIEAGSNEKSLNIPEYLKKAIDFIARPPSRAEPGTSAGTATEDNA